MAINQEIEKIKEVMVKNKRFLLTTHIYPDGDAIGSELALYHFLRKMKKQVTILNPSKTPFIYKFLSGAKSIRVFEHEKHLDIVEKSDVIFILDISKWVRLGKVSNSIKESNAIKICIDHHLKGETIGDITYTRQDSCATTELVYDLLKSFDFEINKKIAEIIYVGILTDTASFRYDDSIINAHKMAIELLKTGINSSELFDKVYLRYPLARMHLLGKVLSQVKLEFNGKVAWIAVRKRDLRKLKIKVEEIEGFVDFPMAIDSVVVVLFFNEIRKNVVNIHFRSRNGFDVSQIAEKFGGGGHSNSAGALIEGNFDAIIKDVLDEIEKIL